MTAFSPKTIEQIERELSKNQETIEILRQQVEMYRQQESSSSKFVVENGDKAHKNNNNNKVSNPEVKKSETPSVGKTNDPVNKASETSVKPKARLRAIKIPKTQATDVENNKSSINNNKTQQSPQQPQPPQQQQQEQQTSLDGENFGSRRPRAITSETRAELIKNIETFSLRDVLNKYCLQELALANWANKRPILIGDFQTLERALSRINAHSIRSLPVVNKNQVVIGLIDIMDIVASISESLKTMGEAHVTHTQDHTGKVSVRNDFMSKTVGSLLTEKKKYYIASNQISLLLAIEYMVSTNQERFMIVDREVAGNVAKFSQAEKFLDGLVTQADVVRFLSQNTTLLRQEPLFQKTLAELNLGIRPPLTISKNEIASKAFIQMHESKRDAAAVVDDSGKLIANISASDLKGLTRSNCVSLSQTLEKFLTRDWKRGWWVKLYTADMNDTLFFIVMQFVASGVHRLYIVDNDGKPVGEVNHMDILKILLQIK